MTPEQLEKCGRAVFPGRNWKDSLAKALNVHRVTVYRWAAGDFIVPDSRAEEIHDLMRERHKEIAKILGII